MYEYVFFSDGILFCFISMFLDFHFVTALLSSPLRENKDLRHLQCHGGLISFICLFLFLQTLVELG